jgi:hypothetical protein
MALLFNSFRTELVGVKDDGTEVPTGLGFSWKCNSLGANGLGGIVLESVFDPSTTPPVIAGGITDIEVLYLFSASSSS